MPTTTSPTAAATTMDQPSSVRAADDHGRRVVVALGVRTVGQPAVDDVAGPVPDVDRMVPDALVEPGDDRELDGDLQVDVPGGVALEDHLDELALQVVEVRVHVVQGRGADAVEVEVRLGGLLEQHLGLVAHLLDDARVGADRVRDRRSDVRPCRC